MKLVATSSVSFWRNTLRWTCHADIVADGSQAIVAETKRLFLSCASEWSEKQAKVLRDFIHFERLLHGDHDSVAEDVAYIFFDLWKFPIDSRLFLSTWGRGMQWDSSRPLD